MKLKFIFIAPLVAQTGFAMPALAQDDVSFTTDNLAEQVLDYTPVQRDSVSDQDFRQGVFYLEQTKSAVNNDPANFNVAHYWNVAVAFLTLQEPKERVAMAFEAAIDDDLPSVCEYLDHPSGRRTFERAIPETILPLHAPCASITAQEEDFDVEAYTQAHGLNLALVTMMVEILEDDQRYRSPLDDRQAALDAQNQAKIDTLFDEYGAYIGRSLVGEDLDYVMFLVIQHSNLEYMERYLPYLHGAIRVGELDDVTPLKMLLDRIHVARDGYQIFGSQGSAPIADEDIRQAIIDTYQISDL